MVSSASPSALSAPQQPRWTSPRAPLLPTTTQSAQSYLRPRQREKVHTLACRWRSKVRASEDGVGGAGRHCHRRHTFPMSPSCHCCRKAVAATATIAVVLSRRCHRRRRHALDASQLLLPSCCHRCHHRAKPAPQRFRHPCQAAVTATVTSTIATRCAAPTCHFRHRCHAAAAILPPPPPSCRCHRGVWHLLVKATGNFIVRQSSLGTKSNRRGIWIPQ